MMHRFLRTAAFFCLLGVTSGWLSSNQMWNGLKLPWNLNPFSQGFSSMPRDKNSDSMGDFKYQSSWCGLNMKFRGYRYWHTNDATIMLLFDVNGYIAGIQYALPATSYKPSSAMAGHPTVADTINGQQYNVLTVYFVDPSIICTTGRSKSDYNKQGTGYTMIIQNGTDVSAGNLLTIPLKETDLQSKMPEWIGPKCFITMGNHYWFNIQENMDCGNFFPFCLLYNSGKLNAFCMGVNAEWKDDYVDSPHPTAGVLAFREIRRTKWALFPVITPLPLPNNHVHFYVMVHDVVVW